MSLDIIAVLPLNMSRRNPEFEEDGEFVPCVELTEDNENYVARIELPGIPPNQINLTFSDGKLTVETQRRPRRNANEKVLLNEIGYGNLKKELAPPSVIAEKITAEHFHGVLTVRLPKQQPERTPSDVIRTISINPVG